MIKIAAVAVITVLVAVFCKEFKQEYGMYISVAGCVLIMLMVAGRLSGITELISRFSTYIKVDSACIGILLKMLGIAFVSDFSANICKDAGYSMVAGQVEFAGKLSILLLSTPILNALLDTILG